MHLARLEGQRVVVKVQRPGLKELFDIDLKNLRVLAQWLQVPTRYLWARFVPPHTLNLCVPAHRLQVLTRCLFTGLGDRTP